MPTGSACSNCGTVPRPDARFCDGCGSPITSTAARRAAEFKQVTVLFADVVRSMHLAAVLDAERLREVMAGVFNRSAIVVKRYGGTVDKFTGDGIMAIFGAPVALEDHAVRACLAALDIQTEIDRLAADVQRRDGVELKLRIGLNSGRVITGDIDSGPGNYTAVGVQVGMAQRMESIAPSGGVMISESTARLVEAKLALGEPQQISVKGAADPIPVRQLLALPVEGRWVGRHEPNLIGRESELAAFTSIFDRSDEGNGSIVGVVGSAGIGKSRIVREAIAVAASRGFTVFTIGCESHASQVPFHAVGRLLRGVFGINGLESGVARARVHSLLRGSDPDDMALFDDLLGIGAVGQDLAEITSEARQRRLARLVKAAIVARDTPALYVVEDAHWIDEVSETLIAEFVSVIPQARANMVVTYRPEYRGALTKLPNVHTISLRPLDASQASVLITGLIGEHPSTTVLSAQIAERAAGNPFFAQEIVRDLAERGILHGDRGAYEIRHTTGTVSVPATVEATIAARIDRLDPMAKDALAAAAVIGSRFDAELLADVLGESAETHDVPGALANLVEAEMLDQVLLASRTEYAFHHPLTRTVAYEAQLKTSRAQLHRRLAAAIEHREPDMADENAALIAEHLAAADDLRAAYTWHMRAGSWLTHRDIKGSKANWQRARDIADDLDADDPDRLALQIAPRAQLCANAWRIGGSVEDTGFDELRDLTGIAGDKLSLVIGMAGLLAALTFNDGIVEAARLATECTSLIESIGDPTLTVGLLAGPIQAKYQAGEVLEALRLADRVISLADGDATLGNSVVGSPLAMALMFRGCAKMTLGRNGFREDLDLAIATARPVDPTSFATVVMFKYIVLLPAGLGLPDDTALRETAEAMAVAEQSGDPFALGCALLARGVTLTYLEGDDYNKGYELLAEVRAMSAAHQFVYLTVHIVDVFNARRLAREQDVAAAIELARTARTNLGASGDVIWYAVASTNLVEYLLSRGSEHDLGEAQAIADELATAPTDEGFVVHEFSVLRMQALLARARGDDAAYRRVVDRYRAVVSTVYV
jgi:class 3 adenylate cyclase